MLPGNKKFVNNKLQWKRNIKIACKILYNKSKNDFEFKKYCENLEFIQNPFERHKKLCLTTILKK